MSWPIPVIEEKRINLPPNFKNWGGYIYSYGVDGGHINTFYGEGNNLWADIILWCSASCFTMANLFWSDSLSLRTIH